MVNFGIIVFILGITNVVSIIMVMFSCRCVMNKTYFINLINRSKVYGKFYNYHCYYWWIFIISVILHAAFALYVYGIPI